jgi:hypothetical protein
MSEKLKPCPFGSKGSTDIEGMGKLWRGTAGYSDPQYFHLRHHGRLHDGDTFSAIFVEIRARTEEQVRAMWNTRAPDPVRDAADRLADAARAQLEYMMMCNDKGDLERNLRAALDAYREATQ